MSSSPAVRLRHSVVAALATGALVAATLLASAGAAAAAPAVRAVEDGGGSRAGSTASCSHVEQYGVSFAFDRAHRCGRFANGDWWVVPRTSSSGVVVTAVSPAAGAGRHGLVVNPSSPSSHGYDSRVGGYDASLVLGLPYRATAGSSLVKAVSSSSSCGNRSGHRPCLQTAVVLTVLGQVPADGGATVFRPPYYGTAKPFLRTSAIRTDLLPRLAPVAGAPSLTAVRDRFARVQLDHTSSWLGRYLHPADNFRASSGRVSGYGAELARDNNDAALRLMLDDSLEDKMPALIAYLQAGIDWYGAGSAGVEHSADGGHNVGRKVVVTFAGVLLDSAEIKAVAGRTSDAAYSENGHVYRSATTGRALFGRACPAGAYDQVLAGGSGGRDCRDPLGLVDGGERPGGLYQKCCTIKVYRGSSLVARLLPGGVATWNADHFHDYVDRWMGFGTWTAPDPRRRFTAEHGTGAGTGYYDSRFQRSMWEAYAPGRRDLSDLDPS